MIPDFTFDYVVIELIDENLNERQEIQQDPDLKQVLDEKMRDVKIQLNKDIQENTLKYFKKANIAAIKDEASAKSALAAAQTAYDGVQKTIETLPKIGEAENELEYQAMAANLSYIKTTLKSLLLDFRSTQESREKVCLKILDIIKPLQGEERGSNYKFNGLKARDFYWDLVHPIVEKMNEESKLRAEVMVEERLRPKQTKVRYGNETSWGEEYDSDPELDQLRDEPVPSSPTHSGGFRDSFLSSKKNGSKEEKKSESDFSQDHKSNSVRRHSK